MEIFLNLPQSKVDMQSLISIQFYFKAQICRKGLNDFDGRLRCKCMDMDARLLFPTSLDKFFRRAPRYVIFPFGIINQVFIMF